MSAAILFITNSLSLHPQIQIAGSYSLFGFRNETVDAPGAGSFFPRFATEAAVHRLRDLLSNLRRHFLSAPINCNGVEAAPQVRQRAPGTLHMDPPAVPR